MLKLMRKEKVSEANHTQIIKYLIYTFGMTWILWGIVIIGVVQGIWGFGNPLAMVCYILAIFSPGMSAILIKKRYSSKEEYTAFIKNMIDIKKPLKWYLFTIGAPICLTALPLLTGGAEIKQPIYMGFILILPMIVGGGLEEIGWRGLLQPALQKHFGVFSSTLIIAGIWAVWHIPLWFIPWTNQSNWSFLFFCVVIVAFALLLASVYYKTQSIFLCIVCHATINAFWEVFVTNNKVLPFLPGIAVAACILLITIKRENKCT